MRKAAWSFLLLAGLWLNFGALASCARAENMEANPLVYVIPVEGQVDVSLTYIIRRGVKDAMDHQAKAIILEMDTYGGDAMATEEIMTMLSKFNGKTATFVNTKAISAGAFIAFGTAEIYMAPGASIGAAAPIIGGASEKPDERIREKYSSAFRAIVRSKAEQYGHNVAVIDAMVDQDQGLTVAGKEILQKGKLLTLTTKEATTKYGNPPKPLVAKDVANTVEEVAQKMGFKDAHIVKFKPSGAENIARFITLIAPILLVIGIAALYIEMKTPGFGLAGTVALVCFVVFFLGHYIAGIAGYEPLVLFLIGFILVVIEIIHPGLILPGALGLLAMVVALFMAMVDIYPSSTGNKWNLPELPDLTVPTLKMMGSFATAALVIYFLHRIIPQKAYSRAGLVLDESLNPTKGYVSSGDSQQSLMGTTGVAITPLRPAGTAEIGGKYVDVMAESFHIEKGSKIRVIAVEGAKIVVEKI